MKFGQIENHIVFNKGTNSLKENYLKSGCHGSCYLIGNNLVYKEMPLEAMDPNRIRHFSFAESDYFSFPKMVVYNNQRSDENMVGYIMNYIEGIRIDKINKEEKIEDLINACEILEKEILRISRYEGIVLYDVSYDSMRYTKDKEIKLIDTDSYLFEPSEETSFNYKRSLRELSNNMMLLLAKGYPFKDNNLSENYEKCIFYGGVKPSNMLMEILDQIRKETKENITTIEEYKEAQKILKRY